jgi:hypothetical protein
LIHLSPAEKSGAGRTTKRTQYIIAHIPDKIQQKKWKRTLIFALQRQSAVKAESA